MKETSKAVKASDARRGVVSTSFKMTPEQKAIIKSWADEVGMSQVDAIIDAINSARAQGGMSKAKLLAEIERRLK
jgi:ribosome-binding protein aMBF1 (putative translation factor)